MKRMHHTVLFELFTLSVGQYNVLVLPVTLWTKVLYSKVHPNDATTARCVYLCARLKFGLDCLLRVVTICCTLRATRRTR